MSGIRSLRERDAPGGLAQLLESPGMSEPLPNTLRLNQFRGAAMLIMFSVLASRGIGFFREMYIAMALGAQRNTDAYVVAFTIPDLLNYLVAGGALAITFIPILGALLEKGEAA